MIIRDIRLHRAPVDVADILVNTVFGGTIQQVCSTFVRGRRVVLDLVDAGNTWRLDKCPISPLVENYQELAAELVITGEING